MGKFFQVLQRAEKGRQLYKQITKETLPKEVKAEGNLLAYPLEQRRSRDNGGETLLPLGVNNDQTAEILQKVNPHLVSLLAPASLEAERYRTVSFNIEQLHKERGLTVVAVSSPGAGDGKTTTAINLAATLAQTPETRILLIDLDLRRPSIVSTLGLRLRSKGVVGAVTDCSVHVADVTWKWPSLDLTILPAGRAQSAPHEVLKSPRFGELLAEARRQYDYVVLDTPPLAPFPDCKTIGQWVDGFLMVISAHKTPRKLLDEAMATMDSAKFIGIVFNYEDLTTQKYYSYNAYDAPRKPDGHLAQLWRRFSLG